MAKTVENFNSTIVDIGEGLDEEYKKNDIRGKIVLIDGLATPGGVQKAISYGAGAAIYINAKYTHEMIVSPVWGTPVPQTASFLPNIPVISVNFENGKSIRQLLKEEKNKCQISAIVETGFRSIPTLVAEIKGTEEPEKFVLLSGHIDSWHYGVMDNGTANATMMEVARILSKNQGKLKRTLRLAFWSGHSHGRYSGSTWYCDHHWEDLYENCILHINVDSVGAKNATVLTKANCMKETKDLAKEVIYSLTGEKFEGTRFGRAGDHSFWGTGTPSLFMGLSEQELSTDPTANAFGKMFGAGDSGGFGWWWHTTEDTLDKIDEDYLKRDCEIYLITVYRALSDFIIPVNQLDAVKEIEQSLLDWQNKANSHFDLSVSIDRVKQLRSLIERFQEKVSHLDSTNKDKIDIVNNTLMELSRILVPLNYVKEGNFQHDFALTQPAIPLLQPINELIHSEEKSVNYKFILNALVRNRNQVNFSLKNAVEVTKKFFQDLRQI